MRQRPLTALAHEAVAEILCDGDLAVDATVGNGHDTLFLARRLAPRGRVIGFDVQRRALAATADRLAEAGVCEITSLRLCGHERLVQALPATWPGRVAVVMFNLGYLPGAGSSVVTRAETTLAALEQALVSLRPGGLVSLLAYRGHPGGRDEADAVADRLAGLDARYRATTQASPGPVLHLIRRTGKPGRAFRDPAKAGN